ncbi:MAG: NAD(P)H-hydrate dehydratase [Thermoflexus sp.]|uniref:NAD(P)H-hydrate dehydratase n=1 Tax=Thermoflexus sp. TaxID=1969742 RepID=UPI0025FF3B06|nr:NAD(P)H-hydrate dehydratase [Thermoflexus sp.]MCS6964910.1 NAD(P)H-hydrate dehydratase [Thermoflexus sp.]
MKVLTVAQMRQAEAAADAAGHTYARMMERAGHAVATEIMRRMSVRGRRILILVGPGNNGGDGLTAARFLKEAGADVACYLLRPREETDPVFQAAKAAGCFIAQAEDDRTWRVLRLWARSATVIVDALLGTGTVRPLEGDLLRMLQIVRAEVKDRRPWPTSFFAPGFPLIPIAWALRTPPEPWLVAVDGPTGMNYDTGELDPNAFHADLTVTFAYPKVGHFRFPAAHAVGELVVADIGIEPKWAPERAFEVMDAATAQAWCPPRPADAHKNTFGKVAVVAGSTNYPGAPWLAAQAAARVGAGWVTLAVPRAIYPVLAAKTTEITYVLLPDELGVLIPDAVEVLAKAVEGYAALVLGPGLTQEKEAVAFVHTMFGMERAARRGRIGFHIEDEETVKPAASNWTWPPLVVDADGLNALAQAKEWATRLPGPAILTPHPGEMARLTGLDKEAIDRDRLEVAVQFAQNWGHVVVLKGAFTVVAAPDGRARVMPFANPAMATAGTGDVLAGAIAGLRAQGLAPFEAATLGAYLHGLAGERARQEIGATGVTAGDLIPRLPGALRALSGEAPPGLEAPEIPSRE